MYHPDQTYQRYQRIQMYLFVRMYQTYQMIQMYQFDLMYLKNL